MLPKYNTEELKEQTASLPPNLESNYSIQIIAADTKHYNKFNKI